MRKPTSKAKSVRSNPPLVTFGTSSQSKAQLAPANYSFANPPRRRRARRNDDDGSGLLIADDVFANPPRRGSKRVEKLSDRVCHIEYYHAAGAKRDRPYRHEFKSGVCMELLTDGSVRIYSKTGKPLYKWFD